MILFQGHLRKATALLYLKRFKEAADAFGVVLELDASNQQAQTGKQQAALGLKVATAVPDGCWGQLVAPFASTAPHSIKYDRYASVDHICVDRILLLVPAALAEHVTGCLIEDLLESSLQVLHQK